MTEGTQVRPTSEQLRAELNRVSNKRSGFSFGRFLLILLLVVLIAAVLLIVLLPGFVIYGDSMLPTLDEGDVVLALPFTLAWSATIPQSGDMVAFRYGERVLIKRVIGCAGDTVEILSDGTVVLNGNALHEDYALISGSDRSDIEYPCVVPDHCYFVLGDNRSSSVDSRNGIVGFVNADQVTGKIFIRLWPLAKISFL